MMRAMPHDARYMPSALRAAPRALCAGAMFCYITRALYERSVALTPRAAADCRLPRDVRQLLLIFISFSLYRHDAPMMTLR